jgi:cation diffusion facilitator CzcD-associated flavoprotein CzcO
MTEHVDVLVVGAGISGISAGYHLQTECPGRTYAILEARPQLGGTWDLFRYPGIRSDSDMYTLGFVFKPWTDAKAIADGPSILKYLNETVREFGIYKHIRYNRRVKAARWHTEDAQWTVDVEENGNIRQMTCNFLFMCSGYYNYDAGYTPEFAGTDSFNGRIVHPQKWTPDIDYTGKRVVVIGSGATAITLVPEMAKLATHVTMLQRSPTYVISRPAEDAFANFLRRILPSKLAYSITRWRNVLLGLYVYNLFRSKPQWAKKHLLKLVREEMGPNYDINTHFTPRYNPWEQRLCLVPDSDLFQALKSDKASIETDHIDRFVPEGILLKSGKTLEADIVVTATGLDLQILGNMQMTVDDKPINFSEHIGYRGMMLNDIPNLALAFGYTNASWTLKADLTCSYVCRLLNHMKNTGQRQATPRLQGTDMAQENWVDFSSGYFARSLHKFPKQGSRTPWKLHQNYLKDIKLLKRDPLEDGALQFSNPADAYAETGTEKELVSA